MEIETKLTSIEIIKAYPPKLITSLVYFYYSNPITPNSQKSKRLKKSLSEILALHPHYSSLLAAAAVPFSEAQLDCDLSQVIDAPNPRSFLPYDRPFDLMAVQATYFRCGSLAVGLLISPEIAGLLSVASFANAWSAAAKILSFPASRNGGGRVEEAAFVGAEPEETGSRFEIAGQADRGDLSGFPLYEADFGWGRPVRVGPGGFSDGNLATIMDMEALIELKKHDMQGLRLKSNL